VETISDEDKKSEGEFLMAPGAVATAVLRLFRSTPRSTAAGFSVLLFGRAFFAVAGAARDMPVLFAAGAGMEIFCLFVRNW
jgi:hypothetical protein